MNDRRMLRQTTDEKHPNTRQATEETDGRKCRQTLTAQIAKSSLSSNGNNAKDNVE